MKVLLVCILLITNLSLAHGTENELHLGRFSSGDLSGWKEQTIGMLKAKTSYSIAKDGEKTVLVARSNKSASGQIYKLKLDLKEYPTLSWSWKIDHVFKKGDEKSKDGDDFAVRVYAVFPRGFFTKTRAICYVWANKLPRGSHIPNPYSSNIITVAVDSGDELAGQWISHQRNIYEDYKNFFGEEPPKIGAIAIMTDSDNTGESTIGYYGDISLLRQKKTDEVNQKRKDQKSKDTPQKEGKPKEIHNEEQPMFKVQPTEIQPGSAADEPNQQNGTSKEQPGVGVKPLTPPAAPSSR